MPSLRNYLWLCFLLLIGIAVKAQTIEAVNTIDSDSSIKKNGIWKKKNTDSSSVHVKNKKEFFISDSLNNKKTARRNQKNELKELEKNLNDLTTENKKQEIPIDPNAYLPTNLTPEQIAMLLMDSGNYYMSRNEYNQALVYFDSIIDYYPNTFQYSLAYYFKGKCYVSTGNEKPALESFLYFLDLDKCKSSFCFDAHFNIGVLKLNASDPDGAMKEFNLAMTDSMYKNYGYCYFYRAFCYSEKEDYISAVQDLTKFLVIENKKTYSAAEALYNRGYFKAQLNDNRGAIKDYDEAILIYEAGISGKNANAQQIQKLIDTYIVRALAKTEIKKYNEAIEDFNLVLKINPNYATAFRLRGLAEIGKGDTDEGCLDLSRAGELGANDAYNDIKIHCK